MNRIVQEVNRIVLRIHISAHIRFSRLRTQQSL
ncbi:Uncharacterised protein [Mycobacteroides abscessus subsp. abscessus]|nr:Uncharacterised protein [Mycobacteroides abscessus subsp. abscessus]SKV60787.1 Uncharacterised protein [Mycobacteroides abscessus subsp. abscessus]